MNGSLLFIYLCSPSGLPAGCGLPCLLQKGVEGGFSPERKPHHEAAWHRLALIQRKSLHNWFIELASAEGEGRELACLPGSQDGGLCPALPPGAGRPRSPRLHSHRCEVKGWELGMQSSGC